MPQKLFVISALLLIGAIGGADAKDKVAHDRSVLICEVFGQDEPRRSLRTDRRREVFEQNRHEMGYWTLDAGSTRDFPHARRACRERLWVGETDARPETARRRWSSSNIR